MTRLLILCLMAGPSLYAETPRLDQWCWWNVSAVTLAATSAADMATSYGLYELNPLIPSVALGPRRQFTAKTVVIYSAVTAGILLAQRHLGKRHKRLRRVFAVVNFGYSGIHMAAVIHNTR